MTYSRKTMAALLCGVGISALTSIAWADAPATAGDNEVETVIVTARKVSENVQHVPIPVSAISASALSTGRPLDAESISNVVPNVKVFKTVNNSNAYSFYIRGIGRDNNYFNVESPVALYVDDVIYPYQVGPVLNIGGIDRVEVLRGPQGTLYGRNATSGAVKYVTKRPEFGGFSGEASVDGGSYKRFDASLAMTGPIAGDVLAGRIDIGVSNSNGFAKDLTTGQYIGGTRSYGVRASLDWKPTDNFDVYAAIDGLNAGDEIQVPTSVIGGLSQTAPQPTNRFGSAYTVQSNVGMPHINDLDVLGGNVQATWNQDLVTLKSITSYRGFTQKFASDVVGTNAAAYSGSLTYTRDRTFTQEFQATGTIFNDRLKYVAGVFYLKSDTDNTVSQPGGAAKAFYTTHQSVESAAAYVDGTFAITDLLHVTGGLRYTKDSKDAIQSRAGLSGTIYTNKPGSAEWSATSPRIGIDYQMTPDVMLFASWGKGFKGGSLSSLTATATSAAALFVNPELAQNTEVGVKSSWFDRRLVLNANYFWTNYQDQTTAIFAPGTTNTLLITNDAKYHGAELEVIARPVPQWRVRASVGNLHGEYTNYAANATIVGLIDKTPKHVPEFTFDLTTDYTFEEVPVIGGSITMGGSYNSITKTFECLGHQSVCVQEPYSVVDLHLSYAFPNNRFNLILAGTNVTDTTYFKIASSLGARYYSAPAEYSLTFRARF